MAAGGSGDQVKIAFALAGLHEVNRGAEVALIEVARNLVRRGHEVTLFGAGALRPEEPYRYVQVPAIKRKDFEGWIKLPMLRSETSWEEATFLPGLLMKYRPQDFDLVATCAYPFTHWALGRPTIVGKRPKRVFITQNGDWPAYSDTWEYKFFGCDGLVCINPDYLERNKDRYRCALIPNGVDLSRFRPGNPEKARFGLSTGRIALMVSALIPSKNVEDGINAVAQVPDTTLVVAGDGPMRDDLRALADQLLPSRYIQLTVPAEDMPALYRSADVFMHLSVDESFGNVFVEALASGLQIVAYDTPRTRWILQNHAHLAAPRNTHSLRSSLCNALSLADDSKAEEGALRRAQAFGWEAIAENYEHFFAELLR